MTEESYEQLKNEYIEIVKAVVSEVGHLPPHIFVVGISKEQGLRSLISIPIEAQYMKSENSKQFYIDNVLPLTMKKIKQLFDVHAIGWAAEAWMYILNEDTVTKSSVKSDKKEVIIISIDSSERNDSIVMQILRKGKQVTADGDLIDIIELVDVLEVSNEDGKNVGGLFSKLYKRFKD